jgi:hypothetical protein
MQSALDESTAAGNILGKASHIDRKLGSEKRMNFKKKIKPDPKYY